MTSRPARAASASRPRRGSAAPAPRAWALNAEAALAPGTERILVWAAHGVAALLAAVLLAMILGPHRIGDYLAETDFYGAYAEGARLIQHGQLLPSRYGVIGPGYEIALALAGFVVRDLFLAAELLAALATVGTLLLWFHLLRARADARVALAAVLFLATNATFLRYGYGALTDAPAILLESAALFLLLGATRGRAAFAAGVVAALAFLTRYNAIALLPAGLLAIGVGGTRVADRRRAALLFGAGFLVPVLPWVLFSLSHGGRFAFQLHHNIAYEVYGRARGLTWDEYQRDLQPQFHGLWDVIRRNPGAVAAQMAINVADHLRRDAAQLLGWPVAIVAMIGLLLAARDRDRARLASLGIAFAFLFATLVPVFYSERYSLALLPFYATLAGIAVGSPRAALVVGARRRVWLKPVLAVIPLALAARASQRFQARVIDQLPTEVLECSSTLRSLARPGDRVIARKWHVAYHAGVAPVAFPFTRTLPELAAFARGAHARWLYFSWPEAETRPSYAFLLDTSGVVPGLVPRRVTSPHPAVLYEIGPEFGRAPAWLANDTLRAYHESSAWLLIDAANTTQLMRLGRAAFLLRRYDRARAALEALIRRAPSNLDALLLLGNVDILLEDGSAARQVFTQAQQIDPSNPLPVIGLGWASLLEDDPRAAAGWWKPVIERTRHPSTLARMVEVFHTVGDADAEARARRTLASLGSAS